jgi:hypothetical protein
MKNSISIKIIVLNEDDPIKEITSEKHKEDVKIRKRENLEMDENELNLQKEEKLKSKNIYLQKQLFY